MSALESLVQEAEKLDRHSQFLLAEHFARKLQQTNEHREAWAEESQRRMEQFKRGEISSRPASEVFERMRTIVKK